MGGWRGRVEPKTRKRRADRVGQAEDHQNRGCLAGARSVPSAQRPRQPALPGSAVNGDGFAVTSWSDLCWITLLPIPTSSPMDRRFEGTLAARPKRTTRQPTTTYGQRNQRNPGHAPTG